MGPTTVGGATGDRTAAGAMANYGMTDGIDGLNWGNIVKSVDQGLMLLLNRQIMGDDDLL